jgi:hypothetical protein
LSKDNSKRGFTGQKLMEGWIEAARKNIEKVENNPAEMAGYTIGEINTAAFMKPEIITGRLERLEGGIEIMEKFHNSENVDTVSALIRKVEDEIKVLQTNFEPQMDKKALDENLKFWKGLVFITENIKSRREDGAYQVSSPGRKLLNKCLKASKEKLNPMKKQRQDFTNMLRETQKVVLSSNVGTPIGLWINKEEKGKRKKTKHNEVVEMWKKEAEGQKKVLQLSANVNQTQKIANGIKENRTIAVKVLNITVAEEMQRVLSESETIAKAMRWQLENEGTVLKLIEKGEDPGDPIKRKNLVESKKEKSKENKKNRINIDEAVSI